MGIDGQTVVQLVRVVQLDAVGVQKSGLLVVAHQLPGELGFECLLGLDFFRGHRLCVDVSDGILEVEATAAG
jgi:hypothetical protein